MKRETCSTCVPAYRHEFSFRQNRRVTDSRLRLVVDPPDPWVIPGVLSPQLQRFPEHLFGEELESCVARLTKTTRKGMEALDGLPVGLSSLSCAHTMETIRKAARGRPYFPLPRQKGDGIH